MFMIGPKNTTHIEDDELLCLLDGELQPTHAHRVKSHLKLCWNCRARLHKMEAALTQFVDLHKKLVKPKPLKGWREFPLRLARHQEEVFSAKSRLQTVLRSLQRALPSARMALAAALILIGVFVWDRFRTPPSVMADEILARAIETESELLTATEEAVIYEQISLRLTGFGADAPEAATQDILRHPGREPIRNAKGQRSWEVLGPLYARNHIQDEEFRFAAAFQQWCRGGGGCEARAVETKRDGVSVYQISGAAAGSSATGAIREARLTVRKTDGLPLSLEWEIGAEEGSGRCELTRTATRRLPPGFLNSLDRYREETHSRRSQTAGRREIHLPSVPEPAPVVDQIPSQLPPSAFEVDRVETEIRYILHRTGHCQQGMIHMHRSGSGEITLKGYLQSRRQLTELEEIIPSLPFVELAVQVLDEVAPHTDTEFVAEGQARREIRSGGGPIDSLLEKYLREHDGSSALPGRVAALMNEIVGNSQDMRRSAWALDRLIERYGESWLLLSPTAGGRLETMVREHVDEIRRAARRQAELLTPVVESAGLAPLPGEGAGSAPELLFAQDGSWAAKCARLVESAELVFRRTEVLFAASGQSSEGAGQGLAEMAAAVAGLDHSANTLRADLANQIMHPLLLTVSQRPQK